MKRLLGVFILTFVIIFPLSCLPQAIAQEKEGKEKKEIILSTVDIDKDYEILGLVYYRSNGLDLEKIHRELQRQAKQMGADYVVGITYFSNAGYLYGSGTAVKLIKQNP